ncbi:MAG: hypothetical protein RID53_00015 [Coleofasciculus sp. B1-GNL1-01]|uniref:hypothetical protein n=1 Tax=Coleofasciculus sp. B1-GNL1-01 TaxID=3068484 RepID=UPI0032FF9AB9
MSLNFFVPCVSDIYPIVGDRTLGIEEVRSRGSPGICRGGFSRLILMFVITF